MGGREQRPIKTMAIAWAQLDPDGAAGFGLGTGHQAAPEPVQQGAGGHLELPGGGLSGDEAISLGLVTFEVGGNLGIRLGRPGL